MDLSRPESSDLSLGLHPHAHARVHARAAPLRLFNDSDDVKTEGSFGGGDGDEGDDEGGDQHFSLLGHSLCVKRSARGGTSRWRRPIRTCTSSWSARGSARCAVSS